jgi:N,N-dimethylformamidase beta subunit-like, C-terminal/Domain of unknown function (DUF4082)/Mo-co oxidoreductase dimerisation domain
MGRVFLLQYDSRAGSVKGQFMREKLRRSITAVLVLGVVMNAIAPLRDWLVPAAAADTYTAWNSSAVPINPAWPDPSAVEVGVKFRVDVAGLVTGIRFYKGITNTGTHVATLWTSSAQQMASATFTNETASGWQQVDLVPPVAVVPNTVYVASYHANVGNYAGDAGYFATAGVDNAPLHLLQNGVSGGNGVYAYNPNSAFPGSSFGAANYWVDVVFSTDPPAPTATATITPTPTPAPPTATATATVTAPPPTATATATATATSTATNGPPTPTATVGSPTATATVGSPTATATSTSTAAPPTATRTSTSTAIPPTATRTSTPTVTSTVGPCGAPANAIAAENCLTGNPPSEWEVIGAGDASIQGFATDISVNRGQTISFKIATNASNYRVDIYRLGYYAGLGARLVATVVPSATLPQIQPACLSDPATGLVDCGNWVVSATWAVPANAASGIYIARPVRTDTQGASHIPFVVRDDSGGSDLLFQTSDTGWQAYNTYGGNSLYAGSPAGRAYKVSYNRPFTTRCCSFPNGAIEGYLFDSEYPMVRWLERNGFDVSYTTGVDTERRGAELLEHAAFLSVGHDEYWSAGQRANVEAARAAGVHLAFFSGNEGFWKTRWEPSIDGSGTAYRTLVCYKETHANAKIDPLPGVWTGTWRDPRFLPHDGNQPENSLSGTLFTVNGVTYDTPEVPEADGKMRFWRNTSIATLSAGQVATLPTGVLGFEWDSDLDNGSRPPGIVRLSSTTKSGASVLQDYGSTYAAGTATHHLTLYRHSSGALVFGAGTVQWSWGLDSEHDAHQGTPIDSRMQQATVNLFADMAAQPGTLQAGLVAATASTDFTAPTSTITAPTNGSLVTPGTNVTIAGTANDTGGGRVGGIEVSVDGGTTWHPAVGRTSWTYVWTVSGSGSATIRTRAVDDSGNLETPGAGISVTIAATATPTSTPTVVFGCAAGSGNLTCSQTGDAWSLAELVGQRINNSVPLSICGVTAQLYRIGSPTGTMHAEIWTDTGTAPGVKIGGNSDVSSIAPAALTTSSAGQTVSFTWSSNQAAPTGVFWLKIVRDTSGGQVAWVSGPVGGTGSACAGGTSFNAWWVNGNAQQDLYYTVYAAAAGPTATASSSSTPTASATRSATATSTLPPPPATSTATPPATATATATVPTPTATQTVPTSTATATVPTSTATATVPTATATVTNTPADTATVTNTVPTATNTPTRTATNTATGTASATPTFTPSPSPTATLIPSPTATPTPVTGALNIWGPAITPAVAAHADPSAVELGVRFRSDVNGLIHGVRFYKGATNTGTHTGNLWTTTGTLLATAVFTGETASGWQEVTFTAPVAITANTVYVASYHTNGNYAGDVDYFAAAGFDNPPLHALRDGVSGANGVYLYGAGGFPSNTFRSANYWVDVVFTAGP